MGFVHWLMVFRGTRIYRGSQVQYCNIWNPTATNWGACLPLIKPWLWWICLVTCGRKLSNSPTRTILSCGMWNIFLVIDRKHTVWSLAELGLPIYSMQRRTTRTYIDIYKLLAWDQGPSNQVLSPRLVSACDVVILATSDYTEVAVAPRYFPANSGLTWVNMTWNGGEWRIVALQKVMCHMSLWDCLKTFLFQTLKWDPKAVPEG